MERNGLIHAASLWNAQSRWSVEKEKKKRAAEVQIHTLIFFYIARSNIIYADEISLIVSCQYFHFWNLWEKMWRWTPGLKQSIKGGFMGTSCSASRTFALWEHLVWHNLQQFNAFPTQNDIMNYFFNQKIITNFLSRKHLHTLHRRHVHFVQLNARVINTLVFGWIFSI